MNKEQWRWIPGYEGFYEISNMGRARRKKKDGSYNYLVPGDCLGYYNITISKPGTKIKSYYIHRLVAQVWLPPRSEYDNFVEHIDSDKSNNKASNLRWSNRTALVRKSFLSGGHSRIDYGRGTRYFRIFDSVVIGIFNSPSLVFDKLGISYYRLKKMVALQIPDDEGCFWTKLNFK